MKVKPELIVATVMHRQRAHKHSGVIIHYAIKWWRSRWELRALSFPCTFLPVSVKSISLCQSVKHRSSPGQEWEQVDLQGEPLVMVHEGVSLEGNVFGSLIEKIKTRRNLGTNDCANMQSHSATACVHVIDLEQLPVARKQFCKQNISSFALLQLLVGGWFQFQ